MWEPLPLLQDIYGLLITNYNRPTFYFTPRLANQSMAQLFLEGSNKVFGIIECVCVEGGGQLDSVESFSSLGTVADSVSTALLQLCSFAGTRNFSSQASNGPSSFFK